MTIVIRLAIIGPQPLDERITDECDVRWAAGYLLQAMTTVGDQLVLVFQKEQLEPAPL